MSDATLETLRLMLTSLPHLDGAEAVLRSKRFVEIETKDLKVESQRLSESRGLGIRLCRDRRLAQSYTSNLEPASLKECIGRCLEMLDVVPAQTKNSIPAMSFEGDDAGAQFIDPTFEMVATEEKAHRLINLESSALKVDSRIVRTRGTSYQDRLDKEWLWTLGSKRVLYSEKTQGMLSTTVVAEDQGVGAKGYDYDAQTHYYNLNWGAVAKNAAQRALKLLGGKPIASGRYNVLFTNQVAASFVALLGRALSGENTQRGLSFLSGSVGQKIFSDQLRVIDDPHLTKTLGQSYWDAEGVSTRKLSLIDQGVVLAFAHNHRSAQEAQTQSTGHAVRASERSAPGVGYHNLMIEPGKKDFVDLERDLQKGLIVHEVMGVHTANPVTGEFSFGASGVWFENGAEQRPVAGVVISGDLKELFSRLISVGRDLRWQGSYGAPSFLIEGLSISGE